MYEQPVYASLLTFCLCYLPALDLYKEDEQATTN